MPSRCVLVQDAPSVLNTDISTASVGYIFQEFVGFSALTNVLHSILCVRKCAVEVSFRFYQGTLAYFLTQQNNAYLHFLLFLPSWYKQFWFFRRSRSNISCLLQLFDHPPPPALSDFWASCLEAVLRHIPDVRRQSRWEAQRVPHSIWCFLFDEFLPFAFLIQHLSHQNAGESPVLFMFGKNCNFPLWF